MPNVDGNFGEDVYNSFMRYFNDEVLSAFYKEMCVYWLKENINSILMDYIDTKDLSYNNVKMDNFACEKKSGRYMLITIRLPAENLHKSAFIVTTNSVLSAPKPKMGPKGQTLSWQE